MDNNKQHRDQQRRFLRKHGWVAVEAVKPNGAFKNAWIHPSKSGSYSREQAVNITRRNYNRNFYKCNDDFFAKPNNVNSYWAGFLAADCSITNNTISIDLAHKDEQQLSKLKRAIEYAGSVFKNKRHVRLQFNSPKIAKDLKNNFGVTARKSLTLNAPGLRKEANVRAFIRGYMDGDGSIYTRCDGYHSVSFNGTKKLLTWIKRELQQYVEYIGNPSVVRHSSIYKLTFTGKQTIDILEWIYEGSNSSIRMNRKYNKSLEMV